LLLPAGARGAAAERKIGLFATTVINLSPDNQSALEASLPAIIAQESGFEVVTIADVKGCTTPSCAQETGQRYGAELLVIPTAVQSGEEMALSLALIDPASGRMVKRTDIRLKLATGKEAMAHDLQKSVANLLGTNLTEAQWKQLAAFREAAKAAGFAPMIAKEWLEGVVPRAGDWDEYFAYRRKTLDGKSEPVAFDAWYSDIKLGKIDIRTEPAGATVEVDGKEVGKSPVRLDHVATGTHTFKATLDGHLGRQRSFQVEYFKTASFELTLLAVEQYRHDVDVRSVKTVLGWSAAGVAAAALGAGTLLLTLAPTAADIRQQEYKSYKAAGDQQAADKAYAQVKSQVDQHNMMKTVGPIALGLGAVAAAFAAYEFASMPSQATLELSLPPSGATGLLLGGRF
jgi:hypothetical protein